MISKSCFFVCDPRKVLNMFRLIKFQMFDPFAPLLIAVKLQFDKYFINGI